MKKAIIRIPIQIIIFILFFYINIPNITNIKNIYIIQQAREAIIAKLMTYDPAINIPNEL